MRCDGFSVVLRDVLAVVVHHAQIDLPKCSLGGEEGFEACSRSAAKRNHSTAAAQFFGDAVVHHAEEVLRMGRAAKTSIAVIQSRWH